MSKDMMKVILNYNNENYSINIQKYQKLFTIKKKAYQIFFPIKTDIDIKYDNKSMSSYLDKSIGIIFNEKTIIRLDIIPIPGKKKPLKLKPKNQNENKKTEQNNNSQITINNNSKITINTQNIIKDIAINNRNKIKLNTLNQNKNAEKLKTENNINNIIKIEKNNNLYENLNLKKNGKKKLPPIKIEQSQIKKDIDNDIIENNKCNECKKNIIFEYCRKCNKFLCLNCSKKNHSKEGHILIEIDNNEKININRYKDQINNDLYNSLKTFNYTNLDINKENFDINESKKNFENMINSLKDVAEGFKDYLNEENIFNNEDNKTKIENDLNIIKKEITNINDNDGINIFKELNMKDKKIIKLINEYKCSSNTEFINYKIKKLFLDIEDEIDKVMFELEESIDLGKFSELKNNSFNF